MSALAPAERLFRDLGYRFRNRNLLEQALTHRSWVNESHSAGDSDNERMEFLGDAVLDLVITELIMERHRDRSEGELSKLRAALVSEPSLAEIARGFGLGQYLRLGRGEELSHGREKASILSDALEALIAAIYLDSKEQAGVDGVAGVIRNLFKKRIADTETEFGSSDYKTELQELAQKRFKERVSYRILKEEGPDHEKQYEVGVYIEDREYGRGRGRSKKESEQAAARSALSVLVSSPELPA